MTVPYTKPPTTLGQQVQMLVERGMVVGDEEEAKRLLARVSYYRLSGYWHPFRTYGSEQLRTGTELSTIHALYTFDRKLRLIVMEAIEQFEIALRTQITYHLTNNAKSGMCHAAASVFSDASRHPAWLVKVRDEVDRSREPYTEHFKQKYSGFPDVPLWVASETMSMRTLSDLYENMASGPTRDAVAAHFGVNQHILESWNRFLSVVRNICAHHARLWNKELGIKPAFPKKEAIWNHVRGGGRLFTVLVVLRKVVGSFPFFESWATSVEMLVDPWASVPFYSKAMGLPPTWKTDVLWARPSVTAAPPTP